MGPAGAGCPPLRPCGLIMPTVAGRTSAGPFFVRRRPPGLVRSSSVRRHRASCRGCHQKRNRILDPLGVSGDRYGNSLSIIAPAGDPGHRLAHLWPWCHSGGRTTPITEPTGQRPWPPRWAKEEAVRLDAAPQRRLGAAIQTCHGPKLPVTGGHLGMPSLTDKHGAEKRRWCVSTQATSS
jgi:hypothetical protein